MLARGLTSLVSTIRFQRAKGPPLAALCIPGAFSLLASTSWPEKQTGRRGALFDDIRVVRELKKGIPQRSAAHLSQLGKAQLHYEFIGLGDFNFDDLLLHWNPPALFTVSFELALKPPAFLPISELREL
jgi:hypothetical protein